MIDPGQILINLSAAFESAKVIFPDFAEVTGEFLVAMALYRAYKMSDDRSNQTLAGVVTPIVIGGMFIAWSTTTQMVSESVGLSGGALGYTVSQGSTYSQNVVNATLVGIGLLGSISVFRGLLKWKDAGEGNHQGQGDPVWSGLWHIIGGGIALNMSDFLHALGF